MNKSAKQAAAVIKIITKTINNRKQNHNTVQNT